MSSIGCRCVVGVVNWQVGHLQCSFIPSGQCGEDTPEKKPDISSTSVAADVDNHEIGEPNETDPRFAILAHEYHILPSLLGQGSFGSVMAGRRKIDGERVAIKFLATSSSLEHSIGHAAGLLDEIRYLNIVQGTPHIVKLYASHIYIQPHSCVAMVFEQAIHSLQEVWGAFVEFAPEERLEKAGGIDAITAFRHMLAATRHIHEHSVVHRDIKPANMLLCHRWGGVGLVLSDFGSASSCARAPQDASLCQTPLYRAPEVWLGAPAMKQADCWSVACCVCQCCGWRAGGSNISEACGADWCVMPVFAGSSDSDIVRRIVGLLGQIPSGFPESTLRPATGVAGTFRGLARARSLTFPDRCALIGSVVPTMFCYRKRATAKACLEALGAPRS